MVTIKAIFSDGDSLVTRINATPDEARAYYIDRVCNVGTGPRDNLKRCVDVVIIAK